MADLYLKALESERKSLWAKCRLNGLPQGTPERLRIVELDQLLRDHRDKTKAADKSKPAGKAKPTAKSVAKAPAKSAAKPANKAKS